MRSAAVKSVATRLEERSGKKRRKTFERGQPFPLVKTRSGGGKKSKTKGATFEARIAKLFSAYYGCSVRRTPGSGGWATTGSFGPKGDLVFSAKKVPYHVELKKQEGWELTDLLSGKRSADKTSTMSIEKWWKQTTRDCSAKKVPMLIFAKNHVPPLLMLRVNDLTMLSSKITFVADFVPKMTIHTDDDGVRVILLLSDFLRFVRPPKQSPRHKTWQHGIG